MYRCELMESVITSEHLREEVKKTMGDSYYRIPSLEEDITKVFGCLTCGFGDSTDEINMIHANVRFLSEQVALFSLYKHLYLGVVLFKFKGNPIANDFPFHNEIVGHLRDHILTKVSRCGYAFTNHYPYVRPMDFKEYAEIGLQRVTQLEFRLTFLYGTYFLSIKPESFYKCFKIKVSENIKLPIIHSEKYDKAFVFVPFIKTNN